MEINNYLIQKIFENRGYTDEYLYEIENGSHAQLKDADTLAVELKDIHDNGDKLVVYPDFDMDGVSSGCCGFAGFAELGFNVGLYIPDPKAGYGIKRSSIDDLIKQHPDVKAIITCDVGIDTNDAASYARSKGIRFFITDHHKQKCTDTPADVIVDPMRIDETYEHPAICGAFVMQQVLQVYADLYCNSFQQDQIRRLRVFAGFGTISDTMPLLYENRQVVRDAVDICRMIYGDGSKTTVSIIPGCDIYRRAFWGIYALLKVYEEKGVISDANSINEEFFGFYLAPAVNAVKRMDGDMARAFSVFFGNDRTGDMMYLYDLNNDRKIEVNNAIKQIHEMEQPYAPYIYYSPARPGILGLVAQKLFCGRPILVLTSNPKTGSYHGSGRSPAWYPCLKKFDNTSFFDMIGGHETAFGCGINTNEQLQQLFAFFSEDVPATAEAAGVDLTKADEIDQDVDYTIATDNSGDIGINIAVFEDYLSQLNNYRPFGRDFPMPVGKLVFRNSDVLPVVSSNKTQKDGWECIGGAKQHLKIHLPNGLDVICWNQAYLVNQKDSFDTHTVIGTLKFTEFRGVRSIIFDGTLVKQ